MENKTVKIREEVKQNIDAKIKELGKLQNLFFKVSEAIVNSQQRQIDIYNQVQNAIAEQKRLLDSAFEELKLDTEKYSWALDSKTMSFVGVPKPEKPNKEDNVN